MEGLGNQSSPFSFFSVYLFCLLILTLKGMGRSNGISLGV